MWGGGWGGVSPWGGPLGKLSGGGGGRGTWRGGGSGGRVLASGEGRGVRRGGCGAAELARGECGATPRAWGMDPAVTRESRTGGESVKSLEFDAMLSTRGEACARGDACDPCAGDAAPASERGSTDQDARDDDCAGGEASAGAPGGGGVRRRAEREGLSMMSACSSGQKWDAPSALRPLPFEPLGASAGDVSNQASRELASLEASRPVAADASCASPLAPLTGPGRLESVLASGESAPTSGESSPLRALSAWWLPALSGESRLSRAPPRPEREAPDPCSGGQSQSPQVAGQ